MVYLMEKNLPILISTLVMTSSIILLITFYMTSLKIRNKSETRYLRSLMEYEFKQKSIGQIEQKNVVKQEQETKPNEELIAKSNEKPDEELNEKPDEELNEKPNAKTLMIYQRQATIHSTMQFYVGLIMSIVGFILLVCLIIFAIGSDKTVSSTISIVGSLIFEGLSLIFLKESQKLRIRVKEYHDSVLEDSNRKEAIELAGKIHDEKLRSLVQAQLAFQLMGIDAGTLNISDFSGNKSLPIKNSSN
ncbi:hypothetical protein [Bacillus pumilus]|uniref:hypothetical protein n=1 Tax=Bacillus pumilus TaxID=1408 RepID=UPI00082008D5|nr:hypothetical protein [Bacillus pumilus]AOC55418.1 hypothetical protein BEN31_00785 [Bacillus pumilus]MBR0587117.1 hypothetical protein [Bacillus pumilus DW2J2]MBR0618497.1 hypothetical protein [Bacillus pumilus]MBR0624862.1 hypothetical protein [Bacillus pumilus]MCY7724725.1 hypothetical protein [Bacillus pumilus]